jgi:tRNA(Ile)-lysidine synthase
METLPERPRLTPAVADSRRRVRELFEDQAISNKTVLIGFSGGADSLALLAAVTFEAKKFSIKPVAVIVDHGLQENSEAVASNAAATAESLGVKALIKKVSVGTEGGLENAAREARYQAFLDVRQEYNASYLLLGHNLNDQAESVLLGLMRGSGPKSIAGMQEVTDWILRPFLTIPGEQLRQACEDQGLDFWDDPHNDDPRFARVEIRKILNELEASGSAGVIESLSRTAEQMQEAEAIIQPLIEELVSELEDKTLVPVEFLEKLDTAYRRRVIHRVAVLNSVELARVHVLEIEKLVTNWHGQKPLNLPGITVSRVGTHLHFD